MSAMENKRKAEIIRWWAAFGGVILWFLYFAAQFSFMEADMRAYCVPREASGELCGYDYIPVAELIFVPVCLLLFGYPFARFAFGVFAPSFSRTLRWSFAGRIDAATTYPVLQVIAGLGLCWSIFRLSALPLAYASYFAILYWAAWIAWFAAAILASRAKGSAQTI